MYLLRNMYKLSKIIVVYACTLRSASSNVRIRLKNIDKSNLNARDAGVIQWTPISLNFRKRHSSLIDVYKWVFVSVGIILSRPVSLFHYLVEEIMHTTVRQYSSTGPNRSNRWQAF